MVGYVILGAWLLTLVILGVIVISTGLPNDEKRHDDDDKRMVWFLKAFYLIALSITMYRIGEHIASL